MSKSEIKFGAFVTIHSTTSSDMDGETGTILGIASEHPNNNFWIVELSKPLLNRKAIVLTDACLKLVND